MLGLAGSMADGTVLWVVGHRAIESHVVPRLMAAAEAAGRGSPRVCVALPICITDDEIRARKAADLQFARYGELVNYRRVLDIEGAHGPGDVAVAGSEAQAERQLRELASVGATDFLGSVYVPEGEPREASVQRTRAFLRSIVGRL
jgi:alkanesulfonate monooxygenase SsuD/methylene tetrahydromethanopterin reductase-like flavin-dependent oxidoreductase (luciferase family)